jgi:hypothetical protein
MPTTKLGAVLASLALSAGTATVLAATPAQAATEVATHATATLGGYGSWKALYGTDVGPWSIQVSDDATNPVTVGTAKLQQKRPGKDWNNVKTDDDLTDGVSFGSYGTKAKENIKYRVHYLGGTDDSTMTTYDESYSNTVTVLTAWKLNPQASCATRCRFYGKLAPKAKHHKVLIQVKHHGWKRYKVVHTNKRSHWTVFVKPSRGGTKYRALVAGTKHLIQGEARGLFTIIGKSAYASSPR